MTTDHPQDNCIIHCRVSTAKQAHEGDSLEAQELIARNLAERKGWNIVRVFREPYSGRKNTRPLIDEIIAFIRRSDLPVRYYVIRVIDRFTRAGSTEYDLLKRRIEALGVTVVDSYGLIQPKQNTLDHLGFAYDWSVYSPSETAELLEAHRGKQEVRDILTRMIGSEIKLTLDGYKVRQPTDGFLNRRVDIDGKKRVIEVPDPERAPYFIEMFALRATGHLSDKAIVERLNEMGYRTKPHRIWSATKDQIVGYSTPKPLTVKRFQEIVQRPIYCGVRCEKWTHGRPIRTRYPGLVSVAQFNAANRRRVFIEELVDGSLVLIRRGDNQKPRRLKNNELYPYKNVVHCPRCGTKPFLGSASRGRLGTRYPAYHCNRGHYLRVPKEDFEKSVDGCLRDLRLRSSSVPMFREALLSRYQNRKGEIADRNRRIQANLAALRAEQEAVITSLIATREPLVHEKLEARIAALEQRIERSTRTREGIGVTEADIDRFVAWAADLMEHPIRVLKDGRNIECQRALWHCVFDQMPTYEDLLNGTPKLSLAFALAGQTVGTKSGSVRTRRFGWNTLENLLKRWTYALTIGAINLPRNRRTA